MLFKSVKNWLTLLIVALASLAMLVAWLYVVPPLGNRLDQQKLKDVQASLRLAHESVVFVSSWVKWERGQTVVTDKNSLELAVKLLGNQLSARAVVIARDLTPATSAAGLAPFDVRDYPMVATAIRTKRLAEGVVIAPSGRYAAVAEPLLAQSTGSPVAGVVLIAAPLKDVDKAVVAVERALLLATGFALALSAALGYMASYFIARRLKRIERSAEAIAGGDLNARVDVSTEDEIGQLGDTFNIMAARLREAFAAVEYERDRIEILLNDLSEGVVGVASDGTLTIANPAAAELLDGRLPVGAAVDETFPEDVATLWRESAADASGQTIVFEHGDRALEATSYPVGGEADFTSIVVLRDVSAQARLERARRDLIANASHEFKTPLFSLAGFLELIDEGNLSPEEQQEFLQLMRVQVDRLRNLAVSMLDLSRVEAGSIEIQPEQVELDDVARSVLYEFQAQAQTKDLTLMGEGGEGLTAWCDEQRLAQVLRALVDNAVKFSPAGSTVRVTARDEGKRAAVSVSDDGPGISRSDLPHVFERFHRGRDERANTSGAGLGLSIARELTELMGGTISVASPVGGGASFTLLLPKEPAPPRKSASSNQAGITAVNTGTGNGNGAEAGTETELEPRSAGRSRGRRANSGRDKDEGARRGRRRGGKGRHGDSASVSAATPPDD